MGRRRCQIRRSWSLWLLGCDRRLDDVDLDGRAEVVQPPGAEVLSSGLEPVREAESRDEMPGRSRIEETSTLADDHAYQATMAVRQRVRHSRQALWAAHIS